MHSIVEMNSIDRRNLLFCLKLLGCPTPGYYGEYCSSSCPLNCQGGHCDIVDGTCLGCLPGYTGPNCDKSIIFFLYK